MEIFEIGKFGFVDIWNDEMSVIKSLSCDSVWRMMIVVFFRLWLDGVLPSIMDREDTVKEKCLSVMEEVILFGIKQHQHGIKVDGTESFAWRLLNVIAEDGEQDLR